MKPFKRRRHRFRRKMNARTLTALGAWVILLSLLGVTAIFKKTFAPAHQLPASGSGAAHATSSGYRALCQNFHHRVCSPTATIKDPSGGVRPDFDGELESLRMYEAILRENPGITGRGADELLVEKIYTTDRRAVLTKAFDWTRGQIEQLVQSQSEEIFSPVEKLRILRRLKAVELNLPPPASQYEDERELFYKSEIYYERTPSGHTRLRVGGAYLLNSSSWFNLVFTLGHELGHSIDPCELRAAGISIPAYDRLSACFGKHGIVALRKQRFECAEGDQLSEVFADWIATKIAAQALEEVNERYSAEDFEFAVQNTVRDLCEPDPEHATLDHTYHPNAKVRIERVFGASPEMRDVLGCAPTFAVAAAAGSAALAASFGNATPQYCQFDSP